MERDDKETVTVCPYCASGCKINLVVDNGKMIPGRRQRRGKPTRVPCV
ncbi:hypothetical protein ACLBR5_30645 [Escherichia coli]